MTTLYMAKILLAKLHIQIGVVYFSRRFFLSPAIIIIIMVMESL